MSTFICTSRVVCYRDGGKLGMAKQMCLFCTWFSAVLQSTLYKNSRARLSKNFCWYFSCVYLYWYINSCHITCNELVVYGMFVNIECVGLSVHILMQLPDVSSWMQQYFSQITI